MRGLIYFNFAGLILAGAYTGFFTTSGRFAWMGALATGFYLIALSIPVFSEYISLGNSFRDIENQQLSKQREKYMPPPKQQVFTAEQIRPRFRKTRPLIKALVLSLLATGLLAYDYWDWIQNPPVIKTGNQNISNF